ncbi:WbuC family cupin fold metalloprotein [Leptospira sp. GIMC2001]|uniref:WbuC family cupin fold metalloprotein n=1 Tax=Leptospira sp. GIMC2001 TaxID=1513297 RepID=UPI002349B65D|nr:WbuC family cupin fold metalloprotein [Leptospira sp. GIMC2001]WCL49494.1 WbuC family cupin fold metalloprotein [Leptospira sp. GIMC2001]
MKKDYPEFLKLHSHEIIDTNLFDLVIEKALHSDRKRSNHNFHELPEVYQRFLNVLTKGTYVQPHRHKNPAKPETFIALKGKLGFLIFDDSGAIINKYLISSEGPIYGIDLKPGDWHSIVTLSDVCVCFEGKSGPYNPSDDKEFASFAPKEGDLDCGQFLENWESLFEESY